MSTRRPSIASPTHSPVAGISCMTPMAPAELTTPCRQPDSCHATARASATGTPYCARLLDDHLADGIALRDGAAIDGGIAAVWSGRAARPAAPAVPGMTSRWPAKMRLGLAMPLACDDGSDGDAVVARDAGQVLAARDDVDARRSAGAAAGAAGGGRRSARRCRAERRG